MGAQRSDETRAILEFLSHNPEQQFTIFELSQRVPGVTVNQVTNAMFNVYKKGDTGLRKSGSMKNPPVKYYWHSLVNGQLPEPEREPEVTVPFAPSQPQHKKTNRGLTKLVGQLLQHQAPSSMSEREIHVAIASEFPNALAADVAHSLSYLKRQHGHVESVSSGVWRWREEVSSDLLPSGMKLVTQKEGKVLAQDAGGNLWIVQRFNW